MQRMNSYNPHYTIVPLNNSTKFKAVIKELYCFIPTVIIVKHNYNHSMAITGSRCNQAFSCRIRKASFKPLAPGYLLRMKWFVVRIVSGVRFDKAPYNNHWLLYRGTFGISYHTLQSSPSHEP